jgi:hypothetical protein
MRFAISILLMVAATGCNTTRFTATKPDGTIISVRNTRLLWATEAYSVTINSNGATLGATKASADAAAFAAIAEGVAKGLKP